MIKRKNQNQNIKSNSALEGSKYLISNPISLPQKRHYSCFYKVFCCKCFYCCQNVDFSLLTSKNRKEAFERMVAKYLKDTHSPSKSQSNVIMDPFFILVALLLGQKSEIYQQLLEQFGNSDGKTIFSRQDLQFYILQLCTYLVFHQQMSNIQLSTFLERACKIDLHFSLRYYFIMKSLETIDSTFEIKKLNIVEKHNISFRNKINLFHKIKPSMKKEKSKKTYSKQNNFQHHQTQQEKPLHLSQPRESVELEQMNQFQNQINDLSKSQKSDSLSSSKSSDLDIDQDDEITIKLCKKYNSDMSPNIISDKKLSFLRVEQLYQCFIQQTKQNNKQALFESTVSFFNDLVALGELLIKVENNRNDVFQKYLQKINQRLPAVVYVPFTKNEYQELNILKIVIEQSKVFRTKQRAPFRLCFQAYLNPNISQQSTKQKKIKSTSQILRKNSNLKRSMLFEQDIVIQIQGQRQGQDQNNNKNQSEIKMTSQKSESFLYDDKIRNSRTSEKSQKSNKDKPIDQSHSTLENNPNSRIDLNNIKKNIWHKFFQLKNKAKQFIHEKQKNKNNQHDDKKDNRNNKHHENSIIHYEMVSQSEQSQNVSEFSQNVSSKKTQKQGKMLESRIFEKKYQVESNPQIERQQHQLFGRSYQQVCQRISSQSLYSNLQGYKIMNIMVKSNDDLRQQCFAMQLLQQFQRIFRMQRLRIKLYPYEVLPLSYNSGIIQYIPEAITIDELIKRNGSLKSVCNSKEKMKNFISSLVGYSLVTYFLQVKDRHNANIMIKKDGTIVHIDYGFFLSSMPGKGVELEKNVPFKLTHQYIDVLGGVKSKQFQLFRKLFYQGFNSLRKHQHRVLILTKLMYSSYGTTMRCFQKGDEAIEKFVRRFNPRNVRTDVELSLFCQELVNASIQNWRAKWYDRWQYFAQGILY